MMGPVLRACSICVQFFVFDPLESQGLWTSPRRNFGIANSDVTPKTVVARTVSSIKVSASTNYQGNLTEK
jgi:hypothetical protein